MKEAVFAVLITKSDNSTIHYANTDARGWKNKADAEKFIKWYKSTRANWTSKTEKGPTKTKSLEVVPADLKQAKKDLVMGEAVVGKDALDQIYDIVNKKQHGKVLGVSVDLFTASAMQQVYQALNSKNKDKVEKMLKDKRGVMTFADFAMSQAKK